MSELRDTTQNCKLIVSRTQEKEKRDTMRVAIYTRKSTFSEKSDSVKNQDRMCREYINMHFPDKEKIFITYEDESFTGANTKRPALQRMMKDIETGIIDFLIVYQLDRLSRDVRDFSNIYSFMEEKGVGFISVKENIDTSTPLGKAMMYVSVVFAQMERETIANRVYDNMMGLSGQGWWVGGNPPFGYKRCRVTENGKTHTTIEVVPENAHRVKSIFEIFYDGKYSLQSLETYCKHNGIKSQHGKMIKSTQLYKLLTMPYCVPATSKVYDHYQQLGCTMINPKEEWTGQAGVMIYGRSTERNKRHVLQPPDQWRVCIGKHEPFLDDGLWLNVQARFAQNKFDRKRVHPPTLLKGVLRCKCGRLMQVARKKKKSGEYSTWYYCPKSNREGKQSCDMSQISCKLIDDKVLDIFHSISCDPTLIYDFLENGNAQNNEREIRTLQKNIKDIENRISNLSVTLAANSSSAAAKYIVKDIEALDRDLAAKTNRIAMLQAEAVLSKENEKATKIKVEEIANLLKNLDSLTAEERNAIAQKVIKRCVWDGETIFLTL